jgi:hypothetical protein
LLLLVFMIKPLIPRRAIVASRFHSSCSNEPLLHSFIYQLCDLFARPPAVQDPTSIATSTLRQLSGGLLGFLRRDLVLTIGSAGRWAQLVAPVRGRVVARARPFRAGGAMRLTYMIRMVSFWFARVVVRARTASTRCSPASHNSRTHWAALLIAALARMFVWITRRLLWVLMLVGHAISSMMLRQMEFDADRYETRVAGTDTFLETVERLAAPVGRVPAAFADLNTGVAGTTAVR